MIPGPLRLLRQALANLAAEPSVQAERLSGTVVQDELALDFANAYESLASLPDTGVLDVNTLTDLRAIYDRFSVGPDDSLWSEDLASPRWASVRSLAARLVERV